MKYTTSTTVVLYFKLVAYNVTYFFYFLSGTVEQKGLRLVPYLLRPREPSNAHEAYVECRLS